VTNPEFIALFENWAFGEVTGVSNSSSSARLASMVKYQASARSVLDPYRDSAVVIEASDLDFTILRPGWFAREEAVAHQITQKGEPFRGHEVSLNGLCELIVKFGAGPGNGDPPQSGREPGLTPSERENSLVSVQAISARAL
jgi:hypothetical protein